MKFVMDAAQAEREFKRSEISGEDALALTKLSLSDITDGVQALIDAHPMLRSYDFNQSRLVKYAIHAVASLAKAAPSFVAQLTNPNVCLVSLFEMEMLKRSFGLAGTAEELGLAKRLRDGTLSKFNVEKGLVSLLTKPLAELENGDFLKLSRHIHYNKVAFTGLVAAIGVFQAAQHALNLDRQIIPQTDPLAEDRSEALQLIDRFCAALDNPHIMQAIMADRQAKVQLTEIFDKIGLQNPRNWSPQGHENS